MPPILLLKTKSSPHDGYHDFFSANNYTPSFIPVLEHRFHAENLAHVRSLFASGAFDSNASDNRPKYGGMIFTSQRAVEGFANMIAQHGLPIPSKDIPLYTVGPATARTLTTLRDTHLPTSTIHGADSGSGEKLAHLMLQHYNSLHRDSPNPTLLFLVGEQRRDIIPKTLMSRSLPSEQRIPVQEIVVYETGEMASFEADFRAAVSESGEGEGEGEGVLWVVVFSPSGCEAMLRVLGLGPYAGNKGSVNRRKVFVATIGPTTRDYLRGLGFEPHVCAERPSPEGVGEGIRRFMEKGI